MSTRKLGKNEPRLAPSREPLQAGDSWRSGLTSSTARGYTYQWQVARREWLQAHPLCVMCKAIGQVAAATVLDHREPHDGDKVKFWDVSNWQAICKPCHDTRKQAQDYAERYGRVGGSKVP